MHWQRLKSVGIGVEQHFQVMNLRLPYLLQHDSFGFSVMQVIHARQIGFGWTSSNHTTLEQVHCVDNEVVRHAFVEKKEKKTEIFYSLLKNETQLFLLFILFVY